MKRTWKILLSFLFLAVCALATFSGCTEKQPTYEYAFRVTFEPALTLYYSTEKLTTIYLNREENYKEIDAHNDKIEHKCIVELVLNDEDWGDNVIIPTQHVDCSYEYYFLDLLTEHHNIIAGDVKLSEVGIYKFAFTLHSVGKSSRTISEPLRVHLFISYV